ncbi:MAG TPA: 4-(cytidine 5'-diphospho)-2-C-methyl-D-erythritol kinase [Usitatibacteraceae bacterium]|nr:4-(cytidine 5'-diphospho)-2-C-methyl-D-erythritol kinase [Usitatibacteraceae bacterium]
MRLDGPDHPAPAKLNLFLHVIGRRADGYHLLQSAFALIDAADRLRFAIRIDGRIRRVSDLPGVTEEADLVVRAAALLKAESGTGLGADIEVDKRLPLGGGVGGGSSDAATTLIALNRLWKTGLDRPALLALGARLGADVPFFVFGRNAWVEGVGERLTPLDLPPAWYLVLVPPVAVPTGEIFAAPELTRHTEALKIEDFSAHAGPDRFRNDLEAVVAARYPRVREHLEWLARHGPGGRLTGSGACVFSRFEDRDAAERVLEKLPGTMKGFVAQGLEEHPLRGF